MKLFRITLVLCLVVTSLFAAAKKDSPGQSARTIMEKNKDAVILVKIVIEQNENERKTQGFATFINADGLAVTSLSSIDPMSTVGRGREIPPNYQTKLGSITMIMPDGSEVPAEVVIRDPDYDLALIKPVDKLAKPCAFIDFTKSSKPQVMDDVVMLSRLGSVGAFAPACAMAKIQAVVSKPVLFYVPDMSGFLNGLGTPVFTLDGNVSGLLLLRVSTETADISEPMAGGGLGLGNMMVAIIPADRIVKAAKAAVK